MKFRTGANIIRVFKFSWFTLLITIMCDLTIAQNLILFGQTVNIQLSTIGIILFILSFLIAVPFKMILKGSLIQFDYKIIILTSFMLLAALISSVFGKFPASSVMTTFFRYVLLFICFVITVVYCSKIPQLKNFILYSFIFINVLLAISSLLDFYVPQFNSFLMNYFGHMKPSESSLKYEGIIYIRPSGFLTETNLTALSISLSNLLVLFNTEKFKHKIFVYLNYLLSGYVFGMLGSRSALLFYILILLAAYILKLTGRREIIYFFLIFTVVQLATPQTQARYFSRTERKRVEKYDTEVGRVLIWKSSFEAFKTSPIIGVGTDGFYKESLYYMNEFKKDESFASDYERLMETGKGGVNSHSLFVTALTDYGAIGLLFLIMLIISIIEYAVQKKYYLFLVFFGGLLLVSAVSSYAPYYKFYLAICIILYVNLNNNLKIDGREK